MDIRSVTFEQKDPTFKDFLRAAFAYATFRPARARSLMRGEQWLIGKDAEGKQVMGLSGVAKMTIFTDGKRPDLREEAQPEQICRMKGGFRL